jgi:hypothetical protein
MAAIFVTYAKGDVFMKDVRFSIPYNCAKLSGAWDSTSATIVTDVAVQTSEILQHFTGFDDLITTLHFGKNVGGITISGIIFSKCDGSLPGLSNFYRIVGGQRGKPVTLSLGGYAFTGYIADTSVQLTATPDTMAHFTIRMNMTGHTLPGTVNNASSGYGIGQSSIGSVSSVGGI